MANDKSKSFKVLFIYPNTMMATLIPINLTQLAGVLRDNGIDCRLFDTTYYRSEEKSFEEKRVELLQIRPFNLAKSGVVYNETNIIDDLHKLVYSYMPDIICITLVEDTADFGFELLESIKDYDCPVVAGGVHVTACPDQVLQNENVDIICVGEGEEALAELCSRMSKFEDYSTIENLWLKTNNGTIVKNSLRSPVNLDRLPYMDFGIWERRRFIRPMQGKNQIMLHVEFERGCPYNCTYCAAPSIRGAYNDCGYGNYYRRKSNKRLIDEIEYYISAYPDVSYLNFNAECFLARSESSLRELAGLYIEKVHKPFWCQSRPETLNDKKLGIIKDMGCANMQFGIEHGNEEFRKRMLNRSISNKAMIAAIKIVEKHEIPYTVNNIIGFPEETRDMVFDTIKLNRHLNPASINCYMLTPYRGTALHKYAVDNYYLDPNAKTHQFTDGGDIRNDNLSKDELKGLQRTFPLYCRFPESRFKEIECAEKFDENGNNIFEKLAEEYRRLYFGYNP